MQSHHRDHGGHRETQCFVSVNAVISVVKTVFGGRAYCGSLLADEGLGHSLAGKLPQWGRGVLEFPQCTQWPLW